MQRHHLVAAMLLVLLAGLGLHTASISSVTHDEIWHLPVGLRNLTSGDFAAEHLNPPLTRMWASIPLWLAGVSVDETVQGTEIGTRFVADHPDDFQRWYFWGRAFNLFWSVGIGWLIFYWCSQRFGKNSGLLALLLYVTCPDMIAHGSLVTPDAGATFFFLATLIALEKWGTTASWKSLVVLALLCGLSQSAKFTSLVLYPLIALVAVWLIIRSRISGRERWKTVAQTLTGGALSLVILAGSYGFQGLFQPLESFSFRSPELQVIQNLLPGQFPIPLPESYLTGFDEQRSIMKNDHAVFLDGNWSLTGFRSYYLKAISYKFPLITLILFAVSLFLIFSRRVDHPQQRLTLLILCPFLLLLGVGSFEGMQLGLRYIFPVLPLLFVIAGRSAEVFPVSRNGKVACWLIVAVASLWSVRSHPNHLSYFNDLIGGAKQGRYHLIDSNIDWGQDLHRVKEFMDAEGHQTIGLAYFGTLDPAALGIEYTIPPSRQPQPGLYAVSVNFVMGRPHGLLEPGGHSRGVDFQEFGYFRSFEPLKTLGGSIDLYELSESDIAAWATNSR